MKTKIYRKILLRKRQNPNYYSREIVPPLLSSFCTAMREPFLMILISAPELALALNFSETPITNIEPLDEFAFNSRTVVFSPSKVLADETAISASFAIPERETVEPEDA